MTTEWLTFSHWISNPCNKHYNYFTPPFNSLITKRIPRCSGVARC